MPKTEDAFAFRDFDEKRILELTSFSDSQSRWKKIYNDWVDSAFEEGNLIPLEYCTFDDSAFLAYLASRLNVLIEATEYGQADKIIKYFKVCVDDLKEYSRQIERHQKRLDKLHTLINERFLADEKMPARSVRRKLRRIKALEENYAEIIQSLQRLIKGLEEPLKNAVDGLKTQYRTTFSKRLRDARAAAKLSQTQLADRLGMTQGGYTQYENDVREPSLATLAKISKILGVSTDWLLGLS